VAIPHNPQNIIALPLILFLPHVEKCLRRARDLGPSARRAHRRCRRPDGEGERQGQKKHRCAGDCCAYARQVPSRREPHSQESVFWRESRRDSRGPADICNARPVIPPSDDMGFTPIVENLLQLEGTVAAHAQSIRCRRSQPTGSYQAQPSFHLTTPQMLGPDAVAARRQDAVGIDGVLYRFVETQQAVVVV
jgi:hypothetical protein